MSDPLPDCALGEISRTGRCYTNEARAMADEIIACRAREAAASLPTFGVVPASSGVKYWTYKIIP